MEDWQAYSPLSIALLKEAVTVISQGRRQYRGNAHPTHLSHLVDRWNVLWDKIPPLVAAAAAATTGPQWPPTSFNSTDVGFLSNHRLSTLLHGTTPANPRYAPRLLTSLSATPWAMRFFTCYVALLTSSAPHKALYMTPVAFTTTADRTAWYPYTGAKKKVLGTLEGFLAYAADAFRPAAGKTSVSGLFAKWFASRETGALLRDDILDDEDRDDVWTEHACIQRFGTVVTLRRVRRDSESPWFLQVVVFNPHAHYEQVKVPFWGDRHGLMAHCGEVLAKIEEWAGANGAGEGMEVWTGVVLNGLPEPVKVPDSMQLASGFCRDWIEGGDLPEDAGALEKMGFRMKE